MAHAKGRNNMNGLVKVTVWVAPEQKEAVRAFAKALPKPDNKPDPRQMSLLDIIEEQEVGLEDDFSM